MTSIENLVDDLDKLSLEQLQVRHTEIVQVILDLQRVLDSPGWNILCQLLQANAKVLRNEYADSQFSDIGDAFGDQYKKGLAKGLLRVESLLSESITYYQQFRDLLGTSLEVTPNGSGSKSSESASFADPDIHGGSFAP